MVTFNAQLSSAYSLQRAAILIRNSQSIVGFSCSLQTLQIIQLISWVILYGLFQNVVSNTIGIQQFSWRFASSSIPVIAYTYFAKYANFSNILVRAFCLSQGIKQSFFHQYLSSHERFFGKNFRQDASKIYIDKSSLPLLIPKPDNTAESLFAALIAQVFERESNYLISKIAIAFQGKDFSTVNSATIETAMFLMYLHYPYIDSLDPASMKTLNPNDY